MTHVVWFKRDLRLHDHAPLWHAAQRHDARLHAALGGLRTGLERRGQRLVVTGSEHSS
ncbi:MAG: deoxyribodipyrimidine photo-lyase, partial [Rhodospirillales bacterium]|nr:deoxyribodipyrimidine photo-lyase [Rhodospirillales bacterium]